MVGHSLAKEVQFVVTSSLNVLVSKRISKGVAIRQHFRSGESVLADKLVALVEPVRDN